MWEINSYFFYILLFRDNKNIQKLVAKCNNICEILILYLEGRMWDRLSGNTYVGDRFLTLKNVSQTRYTDENEC